MKFALPTYNKKLCAHFGHCQEFAIIETDQNNNILKEEWLSPPEHQPGVYPNWLASLNVDCVIAGGMGVRAKSMMESKGVNVIVGAPEEEPKTIVEKYLSGELETGNNTCDH